MREFFKKILKGAIEHWLVSLLSAVGVYLLWIYRTFVKDWILAKHSLAFYGGIWLLLLCISVLLFPIIYFLIILLRGRCHLKNPKDIEYSIDSWFKSKDQYDPPPQKGEQYYLRGVEKALNIKRGHSILYLPMIAWKHRYGFEMGEETFKLTQLTLKNDITQVFEQYLNKIAPPDSKEYMIQCSNIDGALNWPDGAAKLFLTRNPPNREGYKVEIEDKGCDKILIRLKPKQSIH